MNKSSLLLASLAVSYSLPGFAHGYKSQKDPTCNRGSLGEIYFDIDDAQLKVCKISGWAAVAITGPRGPQGAAGPQGPKGDQGAIGPQGIAGPKGDQGLRGETGPQGVAGPKGDQGLKGEAGAQGVAGAQGEAGAQGVAGAQGAQGEAGAQGVAGAQGEIGPQGPTGLPGVAGPQGIQGLKGDQGEIGPQGPTGLPGVAGPQGIQGIKGDQGEIGPQGPTGLPGVAGPQGPKGDQGLQGLTGPQGPAGQNAQQYTGGNNIEVQGNEIGLSDSISVQELQASGTIKVGDGSQTPCSADNEGAMRFNSASKTFEGCDGSSWRGLSFLAPAAKKMFVSSTTYAGSAITVAFADNECGNLASAASLSGSWKAWFSSPGNSVNSRFSLANVPYVNMYNQTIANSWADLVDGSLQNGIRYTENKIDITSSSVALYATGTLADGNFSGFSCPAQGVATTGLASSTTASWTNLRVDSCGAALRILCVEQ